ncbi:MAG: GNAT family N-acetyltransferase [Nocardioidaceae bacterium]
MTELSLPISTERLLLRPYRPDDVEASLAYYEDPDVARYIPWEPWSREVAEEQVLRRTTRTGIENAASALALVVESAGGVIGDVVLWPADETLSYGEAGWAFHPRVAGQGFATEAVRALFEVAFGCYGMHRVMAKLDARNDRSARLCERLGMTREGHLRRDCWAKGEWTDTVIFGLLAQEWSATRARRAHPPASVSATGR